MGSPRVQRDVAAPSGAPKKAGNGKKGVASATNGSSSSPGLPFSDTDAVGAPASKRVVAQCQGRRTMRKLLDAAMIAFDQQEFSTATRVNDVVELAKTSHGTFYLYFSNKEDLLRALVTEAATEAQQLYDALQMAPRRRWLAPVGGRPRLDPRLLRVVAAQRAPLPGLDRSGHHRSRAHRRHPPDLHRDVRRPGRADRPRRLRPHHRPRSGRHGTCWPCSTGSTIYASSSAARWTTPPSTP